MKKWNTPAIEELNINETAAGGKKPTQHDGNVYSLDNGVFVEEFYPSGR